MVQAGGEDVITALATICNSIWQTGEWPTPWTQSLVITLPKKGNLQQCQNYRTISLLSQPSKVMLKIILDRLKPQVEVIIAEEQAGFRAGRSTTEWIFSLWILCKKHLQHQQDLFTSLHRLQEGLPLYKSSQTSRRPSTHSGMQLCRQPWRSTKSVITLSGSSKTSMTRPIMLYSSTAVQ